MVKAYIILLALTVLTPALQAQKKSVNGFVRDSITLFPITGAMITNGTTNKSVETNGQGFFHIDAAANDYIYALAQDYHYDTLTVSALFADTISILLAPAGNILPNVIVRGKYTKYQLDGMDRRARFEQLNGKAMRTLSNSHPSGFGLTFNLDKVFKKEVKERGSNEKLFGLKEKTAYVDYRFSPHIVNYYTGLKGDALRTFIMKYKPGYEWLRRNQTNEDVMYYLNEKLKEYKRTK